MEGAVSGTSGAGLTLLAGDRLSLDFQQDIPSYGGFALIFTDATGTGSATDIQTGTPLYFNGSTTTSWQHLVADLSDFAGETIAYSLAGIHQNMPSGTFDMYFANIRLLRADGSVIPIYAGGAASVPNFAGTACGGSNLSSDSNLVTVDPTEGTTYYLADSLGTTRMEVGSGGWPLWKGEFTPFGQEIDQQATSMRYKFTGQERDDESGLDNFIARQYSSVYGRFTSPDPSGLNFADLGNPRSLNLYSYVTNMPTVLSDPSGLCGADYDGDCPDDHTINSTVTLNANAVCTPCQSFEDVFNAITGAIGSGISAVGANFSGSWSPDPGPEFNDNGEDVPEASGDELLLARLIFSETSRLRDPNNMQREMSAVGYSAVNRVVLLQSQPKVYRLGFFGASSATLSGVLTKKQFASVGGNHWKLTTHPNKMVPMAKALWTQSILASKNIFSGTWSDPFIDFGGTYGFKTAGSGSPGPSFVELPQIAGSGNTFFGLKW